MENIKICKIPVGREQCEDLRQNCSECEFHNTCDFYWIFNLWSKENKLNGKNTLLGPANPAFIKPDMRNNHIISITGEYDFCCFNVPQRGLNKDYIVIGDIYVDDAARGRGISKKILNYLMTTYDRDIFAKCVRGSSAEEFWSHVGVQIPALTNISPEDIYEHPIGKNGYPKRDLGWYVVRNPNKKSSISDLW